MQKDRVSLRFLVTTALGLATALTAHGQTDADTPPGVEQIIPRGAIPAIVEPQFVTADEADIPADGWVLGVVVDGEARAYSLNLLNQHEIVNDRIGEKSFAAVW